MKKRLLLVVLLSVIALTFAVPNVYAERGGSKCGWHGGKKTCCKKGLEEKFYKKFKVIYKNQVELGLSDKQIEAIKALKFEVKKDLIAKKAAIKTVKVEIKEKMWTEKMDTAAINVLVDKKYDLKNDKAKYLVNAIAKLKGTLSDEQMAKLKEIWLRNM